MLWVLDFSAVSNFLVISFNNRTATVIPDIYYYVTLGKMRFFISAINENISNIQMLYGCSGFHRFFGSNFFFYLTVRFTPFKFVDYRKSCL